MTQTLKVHKRRFENSTICSAPYKKQYPEVFAFLNLRILELFICEACIFLKKYATF